MRILHLDVAALAVAAGHIENIDHHGDDPGPGPGPTPGPCDDTATIAIERVTLLSMEPGSVPLPDTTVIVRERRIAWIGPSARAEIPPGATRIDGKGRWLLPGLVDAHVHIENP